ncbi:hypothetical protein V5799_018348, partial [Amblyomma americanum]
MSDGKERRKPSPEGQGLPSKKTKSTDEEEASTSRESRSPGEAGTSQRSRSQSVAEPGGSQSTRTSKSPKKELGSTVLSLCCGASPGKKKGDSPTAPMQRRTPSPRPSSLGATSKTAQGTPKKSSLRQKTPPPQPSVSPGGSTTPKKSSLKKRTPPREPGAEAEASEGASRSTGPKVSFADMKEGLMPQDDYLFRTFRYRRQVFEQLPPELVEQERRRRLSGQPDYLELAAAGMLGPPEDLGRPSTSGVTAPVAHPSQEPPPSTESDP